MLCKNGLQPDRWDGGFFVCCKECVNGFGIHSTEYQHFRWKFRTVIGDILSGEAGDPCKVSECLTVRSSFYGEDGDVKAMAEIFNLTSFGRIYMK